MFSLSNSILTIVIGGGRVVRRCWINFQCRGVLLIWIIVGQGPIVLAIGADGGCLDIFSLNYHFSFLSPSLWETARYRLKYCLKGPLNPEQPTNQQSSLYHRLLFFGFVEVFGMHLFDISVREDVKSATRSVELSKFSMSKKLLHNE